MGVEIERKFLVHPGRLPPLPAPDELVQGYLAQDPAVRVRIRTAPSGERSAELTIKGRGGVSRPEFNYPLPLADAEELLGLCGRSLRKRRYRLDCWELDHFPDRDLWLAEIELHDEGEEFTKPDWAADEVTHDPSYSNANLATPGTAGPLAKSPPAR